MATVNAGHTTFGELFAAAKFDVDKETAADYNNGGPDYRRVQVGGLPYSGNPDEVLFVPPAATELAITVDGKDVFSFNLKLDKYWQQEADETRNVAGLSVESSDES